MKTTPPGLEIRPRHMDFDLPQPLPRHWHSGNAFKSHFYDAMSVQFPEGERFLIDSVRHFRDRIEDPALKEEIRGFIGQEGHHSRVHHDYNQRLRDSGYGVDLLEGRMKRRMAFVKKHLSPEQQQAVTCSVEHLTSIIADGILTHPQWLDGADPTLARVWRWHALEEAEHKAVTFDVYQAVCGNTKMRRRAMMQTTLFFIIDTSKGLVQMLKHDGLLWKWRVWRDGLVWLWGKNGILRKLVRNYLDFYKADFHPWQHDNLHLIQQYRDEFEPSSRAA